MATEVTLPQLGESVTEGTITEWLVAEGDTVEADQPLFELSSDKIDTEVPAPAAGTLTEIRVQVDETVDVGTVVAIIDGDGGGGDDTAEDDADADADESPDDDGGEEAGSEEAGSEETESQEDAPESEAPKDDAPKDDAPKAEAPKQEAPSAGSEVLASPLVRRLAKDRGVDLSQVSGSGAGGRITRDDVESAQPSGGDAAPAPAAASTRPAPQASSTQVSFGSDRTKTEDLSRIRRRIADKMMESLQTTAQLTTIQEADVSSVMRVRAAAKDAFKAREGVSLSPFAFMARAAVIALRNHPTINAIADFEGGSVTYHQYVNLGIAVDTQKGLIVPNVKGADDLTLPALARGIAGQAAKARGDAKLELSDIEGGTFTVTNTGSIGVLMDTPILNIPESAILGTGAIKRRPVVITDADGQESIAIRDMSYLSLTYDHRLIDGADAARYVTEVAHVLETHDWATEVG